ncbi:MAG: serine hydrolase domain-containing protein [Promethearchaeota archaeon]
MKRNDKKLILFLISASFIIGFIPQSFVSANYEFYFAENDNSWMMNTLEQRGLDSNTIEEMYENIRNNYWNFHSILISRDGYIIHDEYLNHYRRTGGSTYDLSVDLLEQVHKDRHAIWSITKSVTSLLVGIAIDKGQLDNVSQKFFDIFPDKWDPTFGNETKKDITIEHLLTMSSGLQWDELQDAFYDWEPNNYSLTYVLNKTLVHEPGTTFEYSTGSTELLATILQNQTNTKLADYAQQYLFDPIGISASDVEWLENKWEWGSGSVTNISHGGFGIYITPRALTRIGELCLNKGNWNGTQVVSEEWIQNVSTTHITPEDVESGLSYGYLFWIRDDFYSGVGAFGQQVSIISDLDMVVTITSDFYPDAAPPYPSTIINNYIIPAALAENLTIASPLDNEAFKTISPDFQIYPEKPFRNTTWYSFNDATNIIFTNNSGVINQSQWDTLVTGNYSLSFYANSSDGKITSNTIHIIKDIDSPVIAIEFENTKFGKNAPDFSVNITEDFLTDTWYTINDGITNITFSGLSATINQTQWDTLPEGNVSVTVYAQDIAGNMGSDQIIIRKVLPSVIPGYDLLLLMGFTSIIVMIITQKLKIKSKLK